MSVDDAAAAAACAPAKGGGGDVGGGGGGGGGGNAAGDTAKAKSGRWTVEGSVKRFVRPGTDAVGQYECLVC